MLNYINFKGIKNFTFNTLKTKTFAYFTIALLKYAYLCCCIALVSCTGKEKPKEQTLPETIEIKKELPVKNEVIVILKDTLQNFPLSYTNTPTQLTAYSKEINAEYPTLVIPTDSIVNLSIGHSFVYLTKANFEKGDTVTITTKPLIFQKDTFAYPIFNSSKHKELYYQHNFNNLIAKKTPVPEIFRPYSMLSRKYQWKNVATLQDTYLNITHIADSLHSEHLISDDFYNQKLASAEILKKIYTKSDSKEIALVDQYNNPAYNTNRQYYYYLVRKVKMNALQEQKKLKLSSQTFDYILQQENLFPTPLKLKVLNYLLENIYRGEKDKFNTYYTKLQSLDTASTTAQKYKEILANDSINKVYEKLIKANKNGELIDYDTNTIVSFQKVLDKNKGKIVLVDFWASWCHPCRMEIPHLKKIQQAYKDKNFVWVTISEDEDIALWKKALLAENLENKGNNYVITQPKSSALLKNLKIKAIPHYVLFDTNGKIIDANAPYTKNNQLEQLLIKHLPQ